MATSDPDAVRTRRSFRSSSGRQHSSRRSDSNSPFKRDGGLLSVLRQKFSARVSRSRDASDVSRSCHNSAGADTTTVASATLCSSWRSRPRHVHKPIRPAYSDECLSCCGRTMSLRVRAHHHHHHQQPATQDFAPSFESQPAVASTSRRITAGIILCKHCHSKNDHSPSEFELSDREFSQSEEDKVRRF